MTINSRNKGKVGELEACEYLRSFGIDAHRGQQFAGGSGSPDIVTSLEGTHFEVKRVEAGNPYNWLAQAIRDCGKSLPVVLHRRSRQNWIVVLRAEDFLEMAKELEEWRANYRLMSGVE